MNEATVVGGVAAFYAVWFAVWFTKPMVRIWLRSRREHR